MLVPGFCQFTCLFLPPCLVINSFSYLPPRSPTYNHQVDRGGGTINGPLLQIIRPQIYFFKCHCKKYIHPLYMQEKDITNQKKVERLWIGHAVVISSHSPVKNWKHTFLWILRRSLSTLEVYVEMLKSCLTWHNLSGLVLTLIHLFLPYSFRCFRS